MGTQMGTRLVTAAVVCNAAINQTSPSQLLLFLSRLQTEFQVYGTNIDTLIRCNASESVATAS